MKRILLLIAILSAINSTAQDPQLSENIWYLQNVVLSGADNFPPSNAEVPLISLEFFELEDFYTTVCNTLTGNLIFDDTLSNFTFAFITETLILCDLPENANYENLYLSMFYLANEPGPFTYNIVQNPDDTKTLTITAANGDLAIYGSSLLHINQQRITKIKTNPNPIENSINIDKDDLIGDLQLKVYDLLGKLVLARKLNQQRNISIDMSQLTTGVYYFIFETDDGHLETKKIIKH